MFLIDTCVLSEMIKPKPNPDVVEWLTSQQELVVSTISILELSYGAKKRNSARLNQWIASVLDKVTELPISRPESLLAADFQLRSERSGVPLHLADALIAATAACAGRVLVTRNIKDFVHCSVMLKNPFA